jgi:hypothetical protein
LIGEYKVKVLNIFLILIFGLTALAQNPGFTPSNGLFHTHTGRTLDKGMLQFKTNMNLFTQTVEYRNKSLQPNDFNSSSLWLVAANISATYGIFNNLDFNAALKLYQTVDYENEHNLPDDLLLSLKAGSFQFGNKKFNGAFTTSFRIPVGEKHNYPFAEYASGAMEYGFLGALSFYADPYIPDRLSNFHFNIGWWNHNELGETLYSEGDTLELNATKNSSYLFMALAAVIPAGAFEVRFELSGGLSTNDPDAFVYSAEEWVFLTPSLRYKPTDWLSVDLGIDLRMSPTDERQRTSGISDASNELELPKNYPPWKLQTGLNFNFPVGSGSAKSFEEIEAESYNRKVELYKIIQEETEKSSAIEDELKMIKNIREKSDEEIEELKKMLDEE